MTRFLGQNIISSNILAVKFSSSKVFFLFCSQTVAVKINASETVTPKIYESKVTANIPAAKHTILKIYISSNPVAKFGKFFFDRTTKALTVSRCHRYNHNHNVPLWTSRITPRRLNPEHTFAQIDSVGNGGQDITRGCAPDLGGHSELQNIDRGRYQDNLCTCCTGRHDEPRHYRPNINEAGPISNRRHTLHVLLMSEILAMYVRLQSIVSRDNICAKPWNTYYTFWRNVSNLCRIMRMGR